MPKGKGITRESLLHQFYRGNFPNGTWKTFKTIASSGEADYQNAIAEERNKNPSTINQQIQLLLDRDWIGIKGIGKERGGPILYGVTERGHNLLKDIIRKLKKGRDKFVEKIDELEKIEGEWGKQTLYRKKLKKLKEVT